MKIKRLPVLLLLLLFVQCSKEKNNDPSPDLGKGLLAYLELNGQFKDSAGNFDVTSGGFLSWAKNRHGYGNRALSCNGGLFSFAVPWWRANPITVSLWVKPNGLDVTGCLLSSHEGTFGMYQQQSKIGFSICNPDTAFAFAEVAAEWTHVTGTFDGNDIKTYINGKLATSTHHPGVPDVSSMIVMGTWQIPEWKGVVDDIRFYNRVLTAEEIRRLYAL